jgi:hypothetical protein
MVISYGLFAALTVGGGISGFLEITESDVEWRKLLVCWR